MKHIILSGVQGSGKGTQARKIAKMYRYELFEMGLCLRAFAMSDHPRAEEIRNILEYGTLAPIDIVQYVLETSIATRGDRPTIYDGTIRTVEQDRVYRHILGDFFVIWFDLPREEAMKRLSGRRYDPVTQEIFGPDMSLDYNPKTGVKLLVRTDDTPEAIAKRLDIFYNTTSPLLDVWRADNIPVHVIDSS